MVKDDRTLVAFFDGTWREGLELLEAAREYLADPETAAPGDRRAVMQLVMSCESMRLTARLAHIMAWLLMQRAVFAGEIAPEEAGRPENRLGGAEVCGVSGPWPEAEAALPARLRELLDRSLGLYRRLARLDEMMCLRVEAALAAASTPALSPSAPGPGTAS